jgi:hypothetical protein
MTAPVTSVAEPQNPKRAHRGSAEPPEGSQRYSDEVTGVVSAAACHDHVTSHARALEYCGPLASDHVR